MRVGFNDRQIAYTAIAGETHLKDAAGKPRASLFRLRLFRRHRVSNRDVDPAPKPFLFKCGPGSASLWLHMGGIWPESA